jgi:hypothetical protein
VLPVSVDGWPTTGAKQVEYISEQQSAMLFLHARHRCNCLLTRSWLWPAEPAGLPAACGNAATIRGIALPTFGRLERSRQVAG